MHYISQTQIFTYTVYVNIDNYDFFIKWKIVVVAIVAS